MLKRILNNQAGVTILEGLIALGLLAVVAGGSFAVLLSVSRQSSQPDIREEMAYAVEKANDELQLFTSLVNYTQLDTSTSRELSSNYPQGLCGNDPKPLEIWTAGNPVEHDITCRLPTLCDVNQSSYFKYFVYHVQDVNLTDRIGSSLRDSSALDNMPVLKIQFDIACNGYKL